MRSALLAALLLAAACGTGTDGKPVAPPTTPEPAPPPTVEAEVWLYSGSPDGYYVGDKIRVVVDFEQRTTVEDSPRLAIEIGDHVRLADFSPWVEDDFPPERPSFLQRFDYEVRADDEDADGISIQADALDFSEGAFLNAAGVEIEVEITAVAPVRHSPNPVEPGAALDAHRVFGQPEPRVCTDERERAWEYFFPPLVEEWDTTPFRFYWDEGIPESERTDAEYFLGIVVDMSRRIKEQLGYSILEVGGWIDEDERGFGIGDHNFVDCVGVRPGGIVATVVPGLPPQRDTPSAGARPQCAALYFTGGDIVTNRNVMDHEIFHLFGFGHQDLAYAPHPGAGVRMTTALTGVQNATFDDIDALGCVFPHPDFPRH